MIRESEGRQPHFRQADPTPVDANFLHRGPYFSSSHFIDRIDPYPLMAEGSSREARPWKEESSSV
jgi:hypothetical protein